MRRRPGHQMAMLLLSLMGECLCSLCHQNPYAVSSASSLTGLPQNSAVRHSIMSDKMERTSTPSTSRMFASPRLDSMSGRLGASRHGLNQLVASLSLQYQQCTWCTVSPRGGRAIYAVLNARLCDPAALPNFGLAKISRYERAVRHESCRAGSKEKKGNRPACPLVYGAYPLLLE